MTTAVVPTSREENSPPDPLRTDDIVALSARLQGSARLAQRRFAQLPVFGDDAVAVESQGRGTGKGSMAPSDLADLISSISLVGMLQPILVEEIGARRLLVAGERRLRAVRWGAVADPENPHFGHLPAVIAPGPLTEEERRVWQLTENLARADLRPGELGAALLLERCAVLQTRLVAADVAVPSEVARDDDPVRRFRRLEALRGQRNDLAAPWSEVLSRLGLQLSPRKAREVVAAFAALPRELSADMDEAGVSVWARAVYARLDAGRNAAAAELWAAVRDRRRPDLLGRAAIAAVEHPRLDADGAIAFADSQHTAANQARRAALRRPAVDGDDGGGERACSEPDSALRASVPREVLSAAIDSLRSLLELLRGGCDVDRYAAGSLRMYGRELLEWLERA